MSRQKIAAGNWKMNTTVEEGIEIVNHIIASEKDKSVLTILAVPFTHLATLDKKIKSKGKLKLAAQNCHHKNEGAFTGEISPTMLSSMGIPFVVLGHSERRQYFHEDNALLKLKVRAALDAGLKIVFCCGEDLEVRKTNKHILHVKIQLEESLFSLNSKEIKNIIIAYEPIWAIGTGETASPAQAQEMHNSIRRMISRQYNKRIGESMNILYGGSIKSSSAKDIFSQPDVDGGLIGGASLDAEEFVRIINSFQEEE
ncbi:MAG: triose-phosphate isomerase [Saprospiraceae bacterium]